MNNVVDEAIRDGVFTIYTNTDPEVAGQVRMYNATASRFRARMKRLHHIRYFHIGISALLISFYCFYRPEMMFSVPALGTLVVLVNFVALFRYLFFLKTIEVNSVVCVVAAALLLFLDTCFSYFAGFNFILFLICFFMRKPLQTYRGYPEFRTVYIYEARYSNPNG